MDFDFQLDATELLKELALVVVEVTAYPLELALALVLQQSHLAKALEMEFSLLLGLEMVLVKVMGVAKKLAMVKAMDFLLLLKLAMVKAMDFLLLLKLAMAKRSLLVLVMELVLAKQLSQLHQFQDRCVKVAYLNQDH